MNGKPDVSVIVPVYNSQQTLSELVQALQSVLLDCCQRFEVVLVNDGSRDASWGTICRLAHEHSWVSGINLARNYGQHKTCKILPKKSQNYYRNLLKVTT
jgi:glycosyltransferase involved in cell wall biosynthesis